MSDALVLPVSVSVASLFGLPARYHTLARKAIHRAGSYDRNRLKTMVRLRGKGMIGREMKRDTSVSGMKIVEINRKDIFLFRFISIQRKTKDWELFKACPAQLIKTRRKSSIWWEMKVVTSSELPWKAEADP